MEVRVSPVMPTVMNFSNSIVLKTILRKRNFVEIYSNGNWKIWGRVFRGLEKVSG